MRTPDEVFPEYYIIRVNEFNQVARTPLEEWVDYLKNGHIKDDTTAPGLSEAKEKLQYMMLSQPDRHAYDEHLNAIMIQNDVLSTAKLEGLAEGLAEGRAKGRAEGRAEGLAAGIEQGLRNVAMKMKRLGKRADEIIELRGLTKEQIDAL